MQLSLEADFLLVQKSCFSHHTPRRLAVTPCQLSGVLRPRLHCGVAAVHDPSRHFDTIKCRIAKGSLDYLVGADLDTDNTNLFGPLRRQQRRDHDQAKRRCGIFCAKERASRPEIQNVPPQNAGTSWGHYTNAVTT
jgi:hypothetical protein